MLETSAVIDRVARLAAGSTSCAVVGNGPYESNLSEAIDSAFVMRCNAFELGFRGIGRRVDLNLSSLYHRVVPTHRVAYPILGVFPTHPSLFEKYTVLRDMHLDWLTSRERLSRLGNEIWTYSEEDAFSRVFADTCARIDAFPTVGLMGICLARLLGFRRIVLSGFTFFLTKKAHYFGEDEVVFHHRYHHRPDRERILVREWLEGDQATSYVLDKLMASFLVV